MYTLQCLPQTLQEVFLLIRYYYLYKDHKDPS